MLLPHALQGMDGNVSVQGLACGIHSTMAQNVLSNLLQCIPGMAGPSNQHAASLKAGIQLTKDEVSYLHMVQMEIEVYLLFQATKNLKF